MGMNKEGEMAEDEIAVEPEEDEAPDQTMVQAILGAFDDGPISLAKLAESRGTSMFARPFRIAVWQAIEEFHERVGVLKRQRNGHLYSCMPAEQLHEAKKRMARADRLRDRAARYAGTASRRDPSLLDKVNRFFHRMTRDATTGASEMREKRAAKLRMLLLGGGPKKRAL